MTKSTAKRTSEYTQRMNDSGFVRVPVWIPADKRQELLRWAEQLRKQKTS